MEVQETLEPEANEQNFENQNESVNIKKYELFLDNKIHILTIEILPNKYILFKLRQSTAISYAHYLKKLQLSYFIKLLNLSKINYNNISKIFELFDLLILDNKVKIGLDINNKNMNLYITLKEDSHEKEYCINLEKENMLLKEMVNVLIEEINEIKNKDKNNEMKMPKNLNDEENLKILESKMEDLSKEIDKKNNEKKELEIKINNLKNKLKKNENIKDLNNNNKNEIKLILKVEKNDLDNKIPFFCCEEAKDELNENNIDIFINNVKYSFHNVRYFYDKGLYYIKLIFKNNIQNCSKLFYNCKNIINIDLSNFNSTKVKNMSSMFEDCTNLINIDFSNFDSSNLENMNSIFGDCRNLINIDLNSFNPKKCNDIDYMFAGCSKLENINLSSLDINRIKNKDNIFNDCYNIKNIKINPSSIEYFENNIDKKLIEIKI